MAEKDEIYSSTIKYKGIFSFTDFYKFCHEWLSDETNLEIAEDEYSEKLAGSSKEIEVKWKGEKKISDYFKMESKIGMRVLNMTEVEVTKGNTKFKSNKGEIKISMKSSIVRDYQAKFEASAFRKFLRETYEKWVIPSRIEEIEDKIVNWSDEFLRQAKAWLDLEGKKVSK